MGHETEHLNPPARKAVPWVFGGTRFTGANNARPVPPEVRDYRRNTRRQLDCGLMFRGEMNRSPITFPQMTVSELRVVAQHLDVISYSTADRVREIVASVDEPMPKVIAGIIFLEASEMAFYPEELRPDLVFDFLLELVVPRIDPYDTLAPWDYAVLAAVSEIRDAITNTLREEVSDEAD